VLKSLSFITLQQWLTAFKSFIQSNADFDFAAKEAIHMLKMHCIAIGVVIVIDEEQSFAHEMV
jgi:hypothetical protein